MIKIFNSCAHPTLDSNWISDKYNGLANFDLLVSDMEKYNIKKSFAIGMKNIGKYDEDLYIKKVSKYKDLLYPIAYFDDFGKSDEEIIERLQTIKDKGYFGIKIHPRFSNINFADEKLPLIISAANQKNMVVLMCTYFSGSELNERDNLRDIAKLMNKISHEKIIFLHSGTVNLLEFVNMMKIYKNVLFDLSYTMCKYSESSIDNDIRYLFKNLDRRICIGADYPEDNFKEFRERFEYFSYNIGQEKLENIAYKNIENFINDCGV